MARKKKVERHATPPRFMELAVTCQSSMHLIDLPGWFSVLFVATMYTLCYERKMPDNKAILCVSVLMYTLGLMHIIVDLQRAIEGFTVFMFRDGGSDGFFNDVQATSYIVKEALYEAQTILGDGFMIYRLYVVWSKDKRILVPGAIWMIGSTSLAFYGVISLSKLSTVTPIFISKIKHIGLSFYAITLGVNTICTGLIAFRIWSIKRHANGAYRSRSLSPVLASIIESGAIYSAALIALITTFASNSWGHYPVFDSMPQLIGIVFTLIIVRIALGLSSTQNTMHTSSHHSSQRPTRSMPVAVPMTNISVTKSSASEPIGIATLRDEYRSNSEAEFKVGEYEA